MQESLGENVMHTLYVCMQTAATLELRIAHQYLNISLNTMNGFMKVISVWFDISFLFMYVLLVSLHDGLANKPQVLPVFSFS